MPNTTVYTNNQYYQNIAAAIRRKNGETTSYKPSEMAPAIDLLNVSGGSISVDTVTITPSSSTQTFTPAAGYVGFNPVTVNAVPTDTNNTFTTNGTKTPAAGKWFSSVIINVPVGSTINNQDKIVIPSTTAQVITASSGYTGLGTVTVEGVPIDTNNTFTTNGTKVAESGKWFSSVIINVPTGGGTTINNQDITITPTESRQTLTASSGYTGIGTVTVEPIPSEYLVPTGTLTVTVNGTHNVAAYQNVYVNVPTSTGPSVGGMIYTEEADANGGTVMIINAVDLSADTVTPEALVTGYTAHDSTGTAIVGTFSGQVINNQNRTITSSTVSQTITASSGYTGLGTVTVNAIAVAAQASPVITVNSSGLISATATQGTGYVNGGTVTTTSQLATQAGVTITPSETAQTAVASYKWTTGTITVAAVPVDSNNSFSANGTYTPASGKWFDSVTVSVPATVATLTTTTVTYTPSETAQTTTINTPTGYDGLSKVTVNIGAISNTYVGSGITTRTTLATNANTVTASAGYYPNSVSYTVPAMTVPTSTSASNNGGTRKITVTPGTTSQYINLPTGYNNATAYFQINAMTNGSAIPAATISATGANVTVGTNVLTFTKSITLTPQVTAGYISAGTAAARTVTLTATITTKAAATYTPGTTNQTIAANQYLTGAQTIQGDADLVAGNIKAGVNIFNINGTFTSDATATASDIVSSKTAYVNGSKVTGNLVINKYYTGTTTPASSLGNNGDIYFQNGGSL